MTDNRLGEIKQIQKQIVQALETGQDVKQLRDKLARVRAEIAADAEIAELQKAANERQALRDKAEAVKVKVEKQSKSIDRFLELRDTLVSQLQPLLEPMKELAKMASAAWERDPGECYVFNDMGQFSAAVRQIPMGYLPADFGCPFLEMAGGEVDAYGKGSEAYSYFMASLGILANFTKGNSQLPLRPAEGLMALDNESEAIETETDIYPDPPCSVCQHPEREAIDKALTEGVSLRDIAAQYGPSKSTLSRHKAHLEG